MKRMNLIGTACCAFLLATLTSCEKMAMKGMQMIMERAKQEVAIFDYTDSEELGPVVTRDIPVETISAISSMGAVKVHFVQDSVSTLRIEGNEKSLDAYNINVERGEVNVRTKDGKTSVNKETPKMTLYVTAPSLSEVYIEGVADVELDGNVEQREALTVNISGVGEFEADSLTCESLSLQVSGTGEVDIDQLNCEGNVEMEVRGAGNIDAKVNCTDLTLRISGAGNAVLDVYCEYLRAYVNGAGNLTLRGECYKLLCNSGKSSNVDTEELEVRN